MLNGKDALHGAVAYAVHAAVEMDGAVVIVDGDFDFVTNFDGGGAGCQFDGSVFSVKGFESEAADAFHRRQTTLSANGFHAGIHDDALTGCFADDGNQYTEGHFEIGSEGRVPGVHQKKRAGLVFGDAGVDAADGIVSGAAATDDFDGDSEGGNAITGIEEIRHGAANGSKLHWARHLGLQMTFVAHDAAEAEALFDNELSEGHGGFAGWHAATFQAEININEDVNGGLVDAG